MTQSRAAHFAARPATSTGPECSDSSATSAQSRLLPAVSQPISQMGSRSCGMACPDTASRKKTAVNRAGLTCSNGSATTARQRCWADSMSLNAIATPAACEPRPVGHTLAQSLVAEVNLMGLVVRRCTQCSAGW